MVGMFGYLRAFVNSWPGVLTVVLLKMTSSSFVAAGLNPWGVCACAAPANIASRNEDVNNILKIWRLNFEWRMRKY